MAKKMASNDFAKQLSRFLGTYLPHERNVSPNTVSAYRDAFISFLLYLRDEKHIKADKVTLADTNFTYVNYTSEYYNYSYLNFVERSLIPLFRLGDSCCFNTKINSTTTGGMCSPF